MVRIAPSILAADFARLGEALAAAKAAGARTLHVDVADGHFAPDITVGQPVIQSLRQHTDLELDVHLLVERPERFLEDFARAGADRIAIHAEATPDLHRALGQIRGLDRKAGLALNPATALASVIDVLEALDFLLVLTADAGLKEGEYIEGAAGKVAEAAEERRRRGLNFEIETEGGIGIEQIEGLISSGADILVAGSAIFSKGDPKANLEAMMRAAAQRPPSSPSGQGAGMPGRES
jgi:ribulose-phosphate 3-epimerase